MHVFNSATDRIPLLDFVLAGLLGEVFAKLPVNGLDLVRAMELFQARRKSFNPLVCVAFDCRCGRKAPGLHSFPQLGWE